jgi:hypothetical protein
MRTGYAISVLYPTSSIICSKKRLQRGTASSTLPALTRYIWRDSVRPLPAWPHHMHARKTGAGESALTSWRASQVQQIKKVITHKLKTKIKFRLHH